MVAMRLLSAGTRISVLAGIKSQVGESQTADQMQRYGRYPCSSDPRRSMALTLLEVQCTIPNKSRQSFGI